MHLWQFRQRGVGAKETLQLEHRLLCVNGDDDSQDPRGAQAAHQLRISAPNAHGSDTTRRFSVWPALRTRTCAMRAHMPSQHARAHESASTHQPH
eukprot:108737-Pleurochrysis_carterae.AAC.1